MTPPNLAITEQPSPTGEAVVVDNVSVHYRSYHQRAMSLKESAIRIMTGRASHRYDLLAALSNVAFTVKQGETFAIIGSNGSGKSTLLKVISGVLKPSVGRVSLSGSVASLIELGVGFDPELNAVENIYLHGSLYRKSRAELEKKVDGILEFAELRDFAEMPIKYYSSGMTARLGFAVAIDIDPEILLVDEILGVGDERFQEKCKHVFAKFMSGKRTIVMVSHDLGLIERSAHRVALLSKGRLVFLGDPAQAIQMYRASSYETRLG